MEKEIILMAKSWKGGGYCTAGIDTTTGEWVRIVSDDAARQHAVTDEDMKYEDGTSPQVLDKVSIKWTAHTPNDYQPENYTMDSSYYWVKTGRADIDEIIDLHPTDFHGELFYNNDKKVTPGEIQAISDGNKYSLALIRPLDTKINVKRWDGNTRPKITACFTYMGRSYRYIKVTDPIFVMQYQDIEDGDYSLDNVYFVASLADPNPSDGDHWKLVATVLEA
ncbi:hypothetical protein [Sporomusa sp. KB1]|uniref:dual OB domain-containing protein n=1 Tax=Sporomusa sp. KB1 TaxID=943346 RepID=UPI00119DC760|nr:hypothetical protein [Sporomusa sp. KB1]TWH49554.1 hypothetical protein Salpa_5790 [Sporomusa sp. KB1]